MEQKTEKEVILHRRTPFNSLHFLKASKFLMGLCPKCLEKQVSKCLLAAASRPRRATEGHVVWYQLSDYQEETLVDNRYSLKKVWKEIWGHSFGDKFTVCLKSFVAQVNILTQFITPIAPI
jgi:hypothetical protein